MVRKILHVDMDAFYASVEQRDRPHLRGRPVAVGGDPNGRGVVAAASYEARRFGVRSAMPSARAVRLCPELVFLPPDFGRYQAVSRQLRAILHDYTDLVEPLSLDEAYLDVTDSPSGLATATEVAQQIRQRVRDELSLTCSVGVASLKFVAKIASDHRKPDGLTVVPPSRVHRFIAPLPVERLWGVGPATARRLRELGLTTIGQIAALDEAEARLRLGTGQLYLWRMANGDDPRPVQPHRQRKSLGAERTFAEDLTDPAEVEARISALCERVAADLGDNRPRTVTLKVRYADFSTITRSRTMESGFGTLEDLRSAALGLVDRTEVGLRPVRLLGVSVSGFGGQQAPQGQLPLPFEGRGEAGG